MSIFSPLTPTAGIFSVTTDPDCGDGLWQVVTFSRAAFLVASAAPMQTLAGEVVLSFVPIATVTVNVQPRPTGFSRFLHGQVIETNMTLIGLGNLDVREGDRCMMSGAQLEVANTQHWGSFSTEIDLRYMGR